jgi:Tol biopolymer transport system component
VVGAAGGLERRLTTGGWVLNAAAWSPESDQLTFIGKRSGLDSLYRIKADGTALTQLAPATVPSLYPLAWPERVPEPCWAPGPRILYTDDVEEHAELFSIDPAGGVPLRLTNDLVGWDAHVSRGCWSPDASNILVGIAFPDQHDILRLPPNGIGQGNVVQAEVTNCPGGLACLGRGYNSSMTRILFYRQDGQFELGPFQIWIMNPDGSGQTRLTTLGSNTDPEWRP